MPLYHNTSGELHAIQEQPFRLERDLANAGGSQLVPTDEPGLGEVRVQREKPPY